MESNTVIVGGGLAGLSLARTLDAEGADYLLLEARDRFGGRVLSSAHDESSALHLRHDLGPSWIWPGQPRIEALMRELELEAFPQFSDGKLVYQDADGSVRRDLDFSTMAGALRIGHGVASIIDALVGQIADEKRRLSHPVTRVSRRPDGFTVATDMPGGEIAIRTRRVVFALPPRVVAATIAFDPPLPEDVGHALQTVPTWMAGHAKLVAVYNTPFWRDAGLSGDGISRCGPLAEVHDASPVGDERGALFGFVSVPAGSPQRAESALKPGAVRQLEALFGPQAANPVDVLLKDWATEGFTATADDRPSDGHPRFGMPANVAALAGEGLLFASSEMGSDFGGLLEGALEASAAAAKILMEGDT